MGPPFKKKQKQSVKEAKKAFSTATKPRTRSAGKRQTENKKEWHKNVGGRRNQEDADELPEKEINFEDKVRDWMFHNNDSSRSYEEREYSSIEIPRESEHRPGQQVRRLFSDEFYTYCTKPLQATNKQNLLGVEKTISDSISATFTGGSSRSQSYEIGSYTLNAMLEAGETGTPTGTGTSSATTSYQPSSGTTKSNKSATETSAFDRDTEGGTRGSTGVGKSMQKRSRSIDNSLHEVLPVNDISREEPELVDVSENVDVGGIDVQDVVHCNDPVVNTPVPAKKLKYLTSTMRKEMRQRASGLSVLSSADQSKAKNEKTPEKNEQFAVPRSPAKVVKTSHERKGVLMPRNSTVLFQSDFVEVIDITPQMSTIYSQKGEETRRKLQNFSGSTPESLIKVDKQTVCKHGPVTSTPDYQKGKGHDFQFDIDISHVSCNEPDASGLAFQPSSREVNSGEMIDLSQTLVGGQQIPEKKSILKSQERRKIKVSVGIPPLTSPKSPQVAREMTTEQHKNISSYILVDHKKLLEKQKTGSQTKMDKKEQIEGKRGRNTINKKWSRRKHKELKRPASDKRLRKLKSGSAGRSDKKLKVKQGNLMVKSGLSGQEIEESFPSLIIEDSFPNFVTVEKSADRQCKASIRADVCNKHTAPTEKSGLAKTKEKDKMVSSTGSHEGGPRTNSDCDDLPASGSLQFERSRKLDSCQLRQSPKYQETKHLEFSAAFSPATKCPDTYPRQATVGGRTYDVCPLMFAQCFPVTAERRTTLFYTCNQLWAPSRNRLSPDSVCLAKQTPR